MGPGIHFTNSFSITIQISWEINFAVIQLLEVLSQQNFAHAMAPQLSCHVQNCVAIVVLKFEWQKNEISITFQLWLKNYSVKWAPSQNCFSMYVLDIKKCFDAVLFWAAHNQLSQSYDFLKMYLQTPKCCERLPPKCTHRLPTEYILFLDIITIEIYIPDDNIKWKHFPHHWTFVRGIHQSPVHSLHKGQWCGALMFSLISPSTNSWANIRNANDLRCHRTDCDFINVLEDYWLTGTPNHHIDKLSYWPIITTVLDLELTSSLTHWGRDKMDAISQTTLSNAFSWMKMLEFRLTFHWS